MISKIDWKRVSENLRCPICGERAFIEPETDGTRGFHTHNFEITREMAVMLSKPSLEEAKARLQELERERLHLEAIIKENS